MFEFKLPEIGEGVEEGEIVKWLVAEGDTVKEDQAIVEIMTDKATVEISSPKAGKIGKLQANEGDVVKVGKPLASIETGKTDEDSQNEDKEADVVPLKSKAKKDKEEVDSDAEEEEEEEKEKKAEEDRTDTSKEERTPLRAVSSSDSDSSRVLASPATRKLARELGVPLASIEGSGPKGRVTKEDVEAAEGSTSQGSTALAFRPRTTKASGGEERIPLRGIRKKISEHLVYSKHTAPHFTQIEEVDFTNLVELRKQAKELMKDSEIKITYLPFIVRALCRTLPQFSHLNASLDDEKSEIVVKGYYNIGIAAATPDGLVVPVVKDADQKTIIEISQEIQALAEKARLGKLAREDLQGGTFTITSTGGSGGIMATPIINHPEVAILGINRIREAPVVRNGSIEVRHMGHVCLSLDHRVVDGAVGADFLQSLVKLLENPALMLLDS